MPNKGKPNIIVTRIRMSMPQGYMLGRTSPGEGPIELVPIGGGANALATNLVATGTWGTLSAEIAELGIHLGGGGNLADSQIYYLAMAQSVTQFPSASAVAVSTAKCRLAPKNTVVFYIIANLVNYAASGYPSGVIATVTFTGGSTTGTIAWIVNPATVHAGDQLFIATSPTFNDSSIEGIAISLVGAYISG